MYKPKSLRAHLTSAVVDLAQNPDKLLVFADEGNTVATGTASLSFEYRYKLNVIITDYRSDPDAVMVALLAWVAEHQIDLLNHPELRKTGIGFEVDFNNHETIDLSIKLAVTERVVVKRAGTSGAEARHPAEPQLTPAFADAFWQKHSGDGLRAEWYTPPDPA